MIAVFVWASFDYNRFIKFWLIRPVAYRPVLVMFFRMFFLACVVGGSWRVVMIAVELRKPTAFYLSVLPFAVAGFAVIFLMINLVERRSRRLRMK